MTSQIYSKITLCVILLFLFQSCGYFYNASPWIVETSATNPARYWSSRTHYPSDSIGMEIVQDKCDIRVYLNLMVCPVEPDDPENQTISFEYFVGSAKYRGTAHVLKGGQRLLLDDQTSTVMIHALKSNQCLTLTIGMYHQNFVFKQ